MTCAAPVVQRFNQSFGPVRRIRLLEDLFHNNSYARDDQGGNPGQVLEGLTVSCINWPLPASWLVTSKMSASAGVAWPKLKDVTSLWLHSTSVCRSQRCTSAGGLSLHKFQSG